MVLGHRSRMVASDGDRYVSGRNLSLAVGKAISSGTHHPLSIISRSICKANVEAETVTRKIAEPIIEKPLDGTWKYIK